MLTFVIEKKINSVDTFLSATAPTLREASAPWLIGKEGEVSENTIDRWKVGLDKWTLPFVGDWQLGPQCGNPALKRIVEEMKAAGLKPATIRSYIQPLMMIVNEYCDNQGNPVFDIKWNFRFCKVPKVDVEAQYCPTITAQQIESLLVSDAELSELVLFVVLAATGVRISEGLALNDSTVAPDGKLIHVRAQMDKAGREEIPTTKGRRSREVDVPEPVASLLASWRATHHGYLFTTDSGRTKNQRNVLRTLQRYVPGAGLHSFRRFRTEVLDRAGTPPDLRDGWIGHSDRSMNARYRRWLWNDVARRTDACAKAGIGFQLPESFLSQMPQLGQCVSV
jgi:integrase